MDKIETYDVEAESIAIIGMSGRFPGAKNIDEFWQNLKNGVESITFFSEQELLASGIDPAILADNNYVKAKGALDNIAEFDAAFFDFSPKEAEITDPQQRLFLECAWEALENAGYDPNTYSGAIGVYGGASGGNSYLLQNLYANQKIRKTFGDYQIIINNEKDFLCTRVSYKLNLSGPSVTVQTACSTSLVAVATGCQSLLDYQCDMVLAGGSNISLPNKSGYLYQEGMIMSPDGHCRAFDAKAQGIVVGSGVGIVVLKRLEDALTDGDYIHAVIKVAAINNDGALKIGYTAPSVEAQKQVIATALEFAEISPETVGYIEAHGTGTVLGDPIEIAALTQAFRASTNKKGYCAIGSVKPNIGHLDTAAGVTGLIKATLALEHQLIPPSLHFDTPNPKLDLANSPFYVNTKLSEWKTNDFPRRAGVSAFGIGGTNVHVILEESPNQKSKLQTPKWRPWQLLLLSAKTGSALETATTQLVEHLKQHPQLNFADVAYTYQVGRAAFHYRRMLVCQSAKDAINTLETRDTKLVFSQVFEDDKEPTAVFMFSGQGSQYVNMGLELYQTEAVFREQVDYCAKFLHSYLGLDLRTVLYPNKGQKLETVTQQLKQTAITQPALFVIEYALAQLWITWGIQPKAMIGHSIGEYVAACLAEVFTLEEALKLVATRGRLMQSVSPGIMLAVPLSEPEIRPLLPKILDLAAINVLSQSVVSGTIEAVEQFATQLAEQGIECQRLHTSHAFHSEMMSPILTPFLEQVQTLNLKPPKIRFLSNVTGDWITETEATDPHYWVRHIRQTVRFAIGLQLVLQDSSSILLEIGPGRTLSTFAKRHPKYLGQLIVTSLRHFKDEQSDTAFLLNTLGQLWMAGMTVNWSRFYTDEQHYRLPLPTYPFERQRYWIEPQTQTQAETVSQSELTKKSGIADWFYIPSWKRTAPPVYNANALSEKPSCWLVFMDECGLGTQLVSRLQQQGQDTITVTVGKQFTRDAQRYTLNPHQRADYDALLQELLTQNKSPQIIVHLWTVTLTGESGLELLDESQNLGFYSLLFLAQALGKQNITGNIQIEVVSNHLHMVYGEEQLCPDKATLLGPCKVIPQEYPNLSCQSIDVVLPASGNTQTLAEQILAEIVANKSDPKIAYRNNNRWVSTFEPVRLENELPLLREEGVYLITGGLGGIGMVLAEHLAKTVRAKLILTMRSAFPARNEWPQWLTTHGEPDDTSQRIRQLQTIETLGAEVLIISADVANAQQMQIAITKGLKQFGQIHGVIHTAGVPSSGVIQRKTPESAANILAPKVRGTLVLEAIFKNVQLDFLVLCSSLTSIEGGFGQVDYCAANIFLDHFANSKANQNGSFTISIAWDRWQEVGMAAKALQTSTPNVFAEELKKGLLPAEGLAVFERILRSKNPQIPQILVSTWDLQTRLEKDVASTILAASKDSTPTNLPKSAHSRPQLKNAYVAPRNELEQTITSIWEKFLGIERVGIFDDFFELGGDSLMAVQLVSELHRTVQLKFSSQSLLENPTIATLTESVQPLTPRDDDNKVDDSQALPSSLVKIQAGNPPSPPIFLVHPFGGHVYLYRNLAHCLGIEQPIWGFKAQGIDGETQPLTQIEEMATNYINALQIVQPTGPYLLGGHSFGGLVAFEMAQQLQALGQGIALLFMMDSFGPAHSLMENADFDDNKLTANDLKVIVSALGLDINLDISVSSEHLNQLELEKKLRYHLESSKDVNRTYPDDFMSNIRQVLYIIKANNRAMNNYIPKTYPGKILFFRAHERVTFLPTNPELSWKNLATDGIDIHEVPGNHTSMIFPPHVEVIANLLKKYLQ